MCITHDMRPHGRPLRWLLVAAGMLLVLLAPRGSYAQEPGDAASARLRAEELFAQGVELHQKLLFARAEAKYREALEHWDHPGIRYALSQALGTLGQALEAYEHLQMALPNLDPDLRAEAVAFEARLRGQLAELAVICDTKDAEVLVNGVRWFVGPGERRSILRPGQYVVVIHKQGYFGVDQPISLLPGQQGTIRTSLLTLSQGTVVDRRMPRALPWAVLASGVTLGLGGGALLRWVVADTYDRYDQALADHCMQASICDPEGNEELERLLSRAERDNRIAVGLLGVGGVAAAAGIVLAAINDVRTSRKPEAGKADVQIVPMTANGAVGVQGGFRF